MVHENNNERLPNGWASVELQDLVVDSKNDLVDGPFGSNLKADEYVDSGIPVFKIQNIKANRFVDKNINYVTPQKALELSRHTFKSGDLIFTKLGDPLGLCCEVPAKYEYGVIVADLIRVRLDERRVFKKFLIHAINSPLVQLQFQKITKGTTRPRVNLTIVRSINISLPPLNEQKRIVAKIEELFTELDAGIANLRLAQAQLKTYRQSLLKHAFEGKLTAAWREANPDKLEPASTLLQRIQTERQAKYRAELMAWEKGEKEGGRGRRPSPPQPLPPLTPTDLAALPPLPSTWAWVKLSSIAENIQIGPFGSLLHREDYVTNGTPLINPSHIKDLAIVPDWNLTVSEEKLGELDNYRLQTNDIIMGRRGEMGRCAVVRNNQDGWLCGTGSLFIRLLPAFHPDFYCLILSSQRIKQFLSSESIGTTMQNLNQRILHDVPVPVCSEKEQEEIYSQFEAQQSVLDQLEQTITTALQQAEALRQSILKKAFAGQLIPQDPHDEPASALLARIRGNTHQVPGKGQPNNL